MNASVRDYFFLILKFFKLSFLKNKVPQKKKKSVTDMIKVIH